MSQPFVHLHLHSAFSLAEGAIHIGHLVKLCQQSGMPALAVTDTNNLFGALEASEVLSGQGIQPITGIELSIKIDLPEIELSEGRPPSVVLLAQSEEGYKSLMAVGSEAYLNPADGLEVGVSLTSLMAQSAGLICLTGGPQGPVDRLIEAGEGDAALTVLKALKDAFADRLYIELQRHPESEKTDRDGRYPAEPGLVGMAIAEDLPVVAANNVYFNGRGDHSAHDALLCIADGAYISQSDRRQVSDGHYFRSAEEMVALFADLPEAIDATVEIAQRCAFRPRTFPPILPSFAGDLEGEKAALRAEAEEGLRNRLASIPLAQPEQAYWDRLEKELGIINRMGFPGYFLIVSDFIKWAKNHDIPVGPGRGSGAGSLVAYALTITDLDPLRFNLLFERFLNPERVSMPDFDVDFCQDRRDEVIGYVQDRYGFDRVAQIITFGKLQARAVLRDVGRVLQMPFGQVDRLCKMVPNNPANPVTLAEAIEVEPQFKDERKRDSAVDSLLVTALKLEGLYRHASTHAAGVVIGDRPLHELVPLYRDPRSPMPVTQFNMKWVEPAGLVKFDFLGLKTLTVIKRAIDYLKGAGVELDIDAIPLDDKATYEMLGRGDAVGVFQLESSGMRATLRGLNADCLEDIIALVSLYRPGPMDNIPTYIDRKAGLEEPDYLHPLLEDVLKETYGVIIYQEQVMQIAQILSGYSLGEADLLRRAMGKKKKEEMDKQKKRFVEGAAANEVDPAKADSIFELVAKFAGYGFNKSHAAAYAWISYQTAFLKANHPAAFIAASMSLDMALTDKMALFASEARRCGVILKPPSVNESDADFAVRDDAILYAMGALKNVGVEAMQEVVKARTAGGVFEDIFDFCERVDVRKIGRRGFEQLAKAGAFDCLTKNRAQVFQHADFFLRYSVAVQAEKASDQGGLFGEQSGPGLARPDVPDVEPWSSLDQLEREAEALGFYLTGHPLDDYRDALTERGVISVAQAMEQAKDSRIVVQLAGIVRDVSRRRSKSGKPFAWLTLSDQTGDFEITIFSELLEHAKDMLEPGQRLHLTVTAEDQGGGIRLTGEGIRRLDDLRPIERDDCVRIVLETPDALPSIKRRLEALPPANGGPPGTVVLILPTQDTGYEVELAMPASCAISAAVKGSLKTVEGVAAVELTRSSLALDRSAAK
ncbi:DNA polymerase III subunit alpha [Parvularcula sp. LCG005]|uniref:DNA polymerase III subunit alpha n=1 Tax=Parvularcula sp. LCG005 TaxID=3078805 RepID=UPI002942D5EA|nr:DNA polymerase III subunit alpha [Parvularcula sp. LCG005]WOI52288.1 DNA polymerase III subunit alpha [Parvularcula sp. LCG005]